LLTWIAAVKIRCFLFTDVSVHFVCLHCRTSWWRWWACDTHAEKGQYLILLLVLLRYLKLPQKARFFKICPFTKPRFFNYNWRFWGSPVC